MAPERKVTALQPGDVSRRMRQWITGVVAVALVAVALPLIWEALTRQSVHFAKVFGGHEFILAGVVVMLGGVFELWGVRVRPERERQRDRVVYASMGALVLGVLAYAARYSMHAESHAAETDTFALVLCSFVFAISAIIGTSAVLLATGW